MVTEGIEVIELNPESANEIIQHSIETEEAHPYTTDGEGTRGQFKTGVDDYQTSLFKTDLTFMRPAVNNIVSRVSIKEGSQDHYLHAVPVKTRTPAAFPTADFLETVNSKARHSNIRIPSIEVSPEKL